METVETVSTYVARLTEDLDRWHERIEHLRRMEGPVDRQGRARIAQAADRLAGIEAAARKVLGRAERMSEPQWLEVQPRLTAALRAMQSLYNVVLADWSRL